MDRLIVIISILIQDRNCWDARTYDEVSQVVQYRWGQQILEWRKWNGNEIVMDAGVYTPKKFRGEWSMLLT